MARVTAKRILCRLDNTALRNVNVATYNSITTIKKLTSYYVTLDNDTMNCEQYCKTQSIILKLIEIDMKEIFLK